MSVDFTASERINGKWVMGELSLNMSNYNAVRVLALIGRGYDPDYGLVGDLTLNEARALADALDNVDLIEETRDETRPGGPRIIHCGTSIDRLRGYAARLWDVIDEAEQLEICRIQYA